MEYVFYAFIAFIIQYYIIFFAVESSNRKTVRSIDRLIELMKVHVGYEKNKQATKRYLRKELDQGLISTKQVNKEMDEIEATHTN